MENAFQNTPLQLNSGTALPALGFGTLIPDPVATGDATRAALEAGFRTIDSAERYRTEREVGTAMAEVFARGAVQREDVFVITKLWNNHHRPERVRAAFEASRSKLRLDVVDLYLIHTPFAFRPGDDQEPRDTAGAILYDPGVTLLDTWRAMEQLVDTGRCKSIGLSDVSLPQVRTIYDAARVKAAVVHVESHPYLPQWDLLAYCRAHGITFQAFAPLGHGDRKLLGDPVISAIAKQIGSTPAQELLAWGIQRGTAILTTSKTPAHIRENFAIGRLPEAAMDAIKQKITARMRFNTVVATGAPGFIRSDKQAAA